MPIKKTNSESGEPTAKRTAAKKTTTKRSTAGSTTRKKTATSKPAARAPRASSSSAKSLVIVESPAKAKTLQKYLGKDYKIEASVGHVKDLPATKLGVDVDRGFEPQYVIMKGKEKVIERIKKSAESAEQIFLAPDPDREGEAIAWHIATELKEHGVDKPVHRATFNEITRRAVQEAIANPRDLDVQLYEAQQARRILDRLVGYKISPLLWAKVTRGLSAGRVQSVAVRLVVEREREIQNFQPVEYWSVEAQASADQPPPFELRLQSIQGKKPQLGTIDDVREVLKQLNVTNLCEEVVPNQGSAMRTQRMLLVCQASGEWRVDKVEKKDVKRHAPPPFITSNLQQEAARKLGLGAKRTMMIAQRLYEGVELGAEGMTALITYMRTDSTRISGEVIGDVRAHIERAFGPEYVPETPNFYKSRKSAQDAHECIRPTDMALTPDRVAPFLDNDQLRLYTLIWNRFVACQMADAVFEQTRVEVNPVDGFLFVATGLVQRFAGFLAVYEEGKDEGQTDESSNGNGNGNGAATSNGNGANKLPPLQVGDVLTIERVTGSQHFTEPPPRYSESSLVRELEKRGIGRPSTYASIVSVIQDKEYVEKDDGKKFRPTELGYIVTDLLIENFPEVLDVSFTAQMEEKLDEVEEGTQNWKSLLDDFYSGFKARLDAATQHMKSVKREEVATDIDCDRCGQAKMVIKWGRNGRFLACPRYPECRNTKEYSMNNGEVAPVEVIESDEICENCGRKLVVKSGRMGRFLACPGYPDCKNIKPLKTGVKCPTCGTGDLVERTSKRGKPFFSCSNYPECKHVEWSRPVPRACVKCGHSYTLLKESAKGRSYICPNEKCKHVERLTEREADDSGSTELGEAV